MKNKILIIFTMALLVIVPFKVKALSGTLTITCGESGESGETVINAGESISCTISGNTDSPIEAIAADLSLTNLVYSSFTKGSAWSEGSISDNKLYLVSTNEINGDFTIGTIVVKANDNTKNLDGIIKLENISYQNDLSNNSDENSFSVDDASQSIRIADTENSLSELSVKTSSGDELITNFNEDTTSYDLEVEGTIDKVVVTPTKASSTIVSVSGGGEKTLSYGANEIKITVTSESNVSKVYTININRIDGRSTENKLIQFSFTNYDFDFSKDKKDYSIILENNISELGLCNGNNNPTNKLCINNSDIAYSDKASISMLYNGNLIEISDIDDYKTIGSIDVGDNTLSVIITAENESKNTYNFTIQRKDKNNKLPEKPSNKEINTNGGTGDFGIILVIVLLVVSLGIIIYMNKDVILKKIKRQ